MISKNDPKSHKKDDEQAEQKKGGWNIWPF